MKQSKPLLISKELCCLPQLSVQIFWVQALRSPQMPAHLMARKNRSCNSKQVTKKHVTILWMVYTWKLGDLGSCMIAFQGKYLCESPKSDPCCCCYFPRILFVGDCVIQTSPPTHLMVRWHICLIQTPFQYFRSIYRQCWAAIVCHYDSDIQPGF